ncbi:TPA: hypothetical protein ACXRY8_004311 [Klebsiella variicola subsp. variicola]
MSGKVTPEIVHTKWPGRAITFLQKAAVVLRDTEHLGSLAMTRLVIDDILKNFETVDFFPLTCPDVYIVKVGRRDGYCWHTCHVIRTLHGIPNCVIRLSAFTISSASPISAS